MEADLFEAHVTGADELSAGINRFGDGLERPTPALRRMAEYYADRTKARVVQGGDPQYKDILTKSRARRKANKTTPPLWDSGGLIEAVTATRSGVVDSLFAMTPDGFIAGTDAPG